mmetsp:Transcript_34009/g.97826  ORF Transcript_34009/g.97826 Transcript_34009/m.97826 type:complete len:154 (+) Transcript_34009:104-565(+)
MPAAKAGTLACGLLVCCLGADAVNCVTSRVFENAECNGEPVLTTAYEVRTAPGGACTSRQGRPGSSVGDAYCDSFGDYRQTYFATVDCTGPGVDEIVHANTCHSGWKFECLLDRESCSSASVSTSGARARGMSAPAISLLSVGVLGLGTAVLD